MIAVQSGRIMIGVDTGGTFTDVVLDTGDSSPLITHKLLSTPDDPSRAVIRGISVVMELWRGVGRTGPDEPDVVHGSTVATNALLEGTGARSAFITTAGFEDTLWIGRQNRPELYALEPVKTRVPLTHEAAIGINERTLYDGSIQREIQAGELDNLAHRLKALGVESVAISLLHSYANPRHEAQIAAVLRRELPDLHVTVSSELLPEFREYERAATCLVNAVVAPPMARYISRLARELGPGRLRVMASAGGSVPPAVVEREPVQTILSGPAGGVVGAFNAAKAGGQPRIITLDMGGTSTDVTLCDGELSHTTESEIAGLPVRLPMIDIHTVGAGGGSAAWLDSGGALRVGPESMGADPGPACYGRQQPPYRATVTDAHAVLGHLSAEQRLGGALEIDVAAAQAAVQALGERCGLSVTATALGILRIVEVTMARAVQRISVERGHDLRDFTLVPFGGAGGLHAARLAEQLGIQQVLIPGDPGLLSAVGMVGTAPLYNFSQGLLIRVSPGEATGQRLTEHPEVTAALAALHRQADAALGAEGIVATDRRYASSLDLRYSGQSYELTIPLDGTGPAAEFAKRHERLYGYIAADKDIEVVAVRLRASGVEGMITYHELATTDSSAGCVGQPVAIYGEAGPQAGVRFERDRLGRGAQVAGPAIISEYSATTLVPAGWQLTVNEIGQLMLNRGRV